MAESSIYDQAWSIIENNYLLVVVIVIGGAIIGLAQFTDAVGILSRNLGRFIKFINNFFLSKKLKPLTNNRPNDKEKEVVDGKEEFKSPKLEKKIFIREKSPHELYDYLKSLPPLHAEKIMKEIYVGRWAKWKGEVSGVKTALWKKGFYVMIWTPPDEGYQKGILFGAYISDDYIHEIEQLRIGDKICIEGRIENSSSFKLSEARIISLQTKVSEPQAEKEAPSETGGKNKVKEREKPAGRLPKSAGHDVDPRVDAFFMNIPSNFNFEAAAGLEADYVWEIRLPEGREKGRTWYSVSIEKGELKIVTQGRLSTPDLKVFVSEENWLDIIDHKLEIQRALESGKMKVQGDTVLLLKMEKIFNI